MIAALLTVAALCGAAGIALLAAAAHTAPGAGLGSAAQVLLFHASAAIAVTLAAEQGLIHRRLGRAAAAALLLGAALFAADLTLRAFAGHRLFPAVAPTGGSIQILGWLAVALAALRRRRI